ncbi:ubiquitin-associated domain-containing protein 1 [Bicyclus anynana]|uniref:Ubiquitin-associated domain-containing protein 1 n=1 Tax=Bicyclus anynana TaxID=110368 RepID=A0A6J1NBI0_BICAN|nr:ubiquitin-associated domain-containing protein 1 [Bicyclus anynana]
MLVSDAGLSDTSDVFVRIVSPEGQMFTASFPDDTLIEEVKNRAVEYFYPSGETRSGRFKIVRVNDTTTLHDFLTLAQEEVIMHEELLLIERRVPEAGTLSDLGSVRAPQPAAIVAATASLPNPQGVTRQPNLQSLLSTNELSYELRKILISLVEAGAKLAASGRNYELTLGQLSAALDEPRRTQRIVAQVITPEELAAKLNKEGTDSEADTAGTNDLFKRADCLERFLLKFRAWRRRISEPPNPEAIAALRNLGFSFEEADEALRTTGCNVPAAASWLIGERGSSVFELVNGLPEGVILQTLLKQPQIQRGLLNTRMLIAFIAMVGQSGSASLWLNSPHGSPLLSQISRTYHSEKYCLAVNQFSERQTTPAPKVPSLFWSGGDVVSNNGFGCYAQRGRRAPILAENYHFSHSMPGLLSMSATRDGELCGMFNITFKALPQFDFKNVVFGRIIRPCSTYDVIKTLGNPLSTHPVIEIDSARRKIDGRWVTGSPNTRLRPDAMIYHHQSI